ncbi:MAG: hypothetical protein RIC87_11920 [Kiloniellales bacterium]
MRAFVRAFCLVAILSPSAVLAQESAEPSNPAMAVWDELVATAPIGLLSYDEAKPLGDAGVEIKGLSIAVNEAAGEEGRLTIDRLAVSEIYPLERAEGPPERLKLKIESLVLTPANSNISPAFFAALEASQISVNVTLDYLHLPGGGLMALQDLTVDVPFLASVSLSLDAAGVNLGRLLIEGEPALEKVVLRRASLTVEDNTLLARLLRFEAKRDEVTFEAAQDEALREIAEELNWLEVRRGGRLWSLAEAVGGLILDAGDTKGPLIVNVRPQSAVDLASLSEVGGAEAMARVLNLTVSYSGSRAEYASTQSETPGRPDLSLSSDKTVYREGDPVVINYGGLPGNQRDWVTVVPLGTPADNWGQWTYTDGKASGSFQVDDLAPGAYEARVYLGWPRGGFDVVRRWYFSVEP